MPLAAWLCVVAGPASAQALPAVRRLPPPAPAAPSAPEPAVRLSADDVLSHLGGVTSARGSVVLVRDDLQLHTDFLSYDQLTDLAHAEGHVLITRGLDWFSADRLDLHLDTGAGELVDTQYEIGLTHAGGRARRIDLIDRERATAHQADYTSCRRDDPRHPPDWVIRGDRIDIDTATNEGHATHARLVFLGVPILAAPSLSFPVTSDRKSGWLPPTGEFSNSGGLSLTVPYYWNLRPNLDLTLSPQVISRRGAGLITEFRYLGPNDLGQLTLSSIPHDAVTGTSRGSLQWAHEGSRDDWLTYSARWQRVTDDAYWKDFQHQMPALTQRLLPLDLSGHRYFTPWGEGSEVDAYARVQRFQTLQDFEDPAAVIQSPYQRSPQLGMRGRLPLRERLMLDWEAEANRFDLGIHQPPAGLQGFSQDTRVGGDRAHLILALSREFAAPWGQVLPRLSLNGATYHSDGPLVDYNTGQPVTDGQRSLTRWIPTFSLDSSFSLERDGRLFGHDVVQTLQPRLLYVLTPYHDQHLVPIYDTAAKDFNEVSIYSDNPFTGVDRIADENQLTAGATTRYNDRTDGRELLRLGMAQRLLFKDQRVTPPDVPSPDKNRVSDLLLWGSSTLGEAWSFDGTLEFDPSQHWTQRAILSTRYHPGPYRTVSLTYRYARSALEQYELSGQWPVFRRTPGAGGSGCGGTLYAVGRVNYSVTDARTNYLLGGLEYDAGCWIGRFLVERQSTGRSQSSTHFLLQLELNGLSTLGTGSLRVLQDNVPGYQSLRNDPATQQASPPTP